MGVQRRRPGAGLRRRRRAHRHGVRPVPPDRHGLAAGRPRPAGDRGRPRRGRDPAQQRRRAVHVDVPARGPSRRVRRDRRGGRPLGRRRCREGRETDARRPPELSTRDNVARAIYTEVREGRGSPHGGVFLDISYLPAEPRPAQAALDVRAVQGARRRRHHDGPDGGRADDALRHGRHPGRRRDGRDDACRACTRRARSRAACTARTGSAATRSRTCSCSAPGPGAAAAAHAAAEAPSPYVDPLQVEAADARARRAARAGRRRGPVRHPARPPGRRCSAWSASSAIEADLERRARSSWPRSGRAGANDARSPAAGPTTPAGTSSSSCATC